MIITRDEFVELLDGYKIKHMEIQIEITPEFSEREEVFSLDDKNKYLNARKISDGYDLLEIRLKTKVNKHSSIIGFSR